MSLSAKYFDPATLAKLKSLSLRGRHLVEGYMAGMHASRERGQSIEFAEHREYSPGDDIRHVDWKVYARTDKLYLKQFEDETNLLCYLVIDCSESMLYRGPDASLSKWEYAQLVVLSLAYLVLDQRDGGSLVTVSTAIDSMLEPSNQARRWQDMVSVLETTETQKHTNLQAVLGDLSTRIAKRSLVIIVSDFLDDLAGVSRGAANLRHHRHDVILLQVLDRSEMEFPFRSTTKFIGLEGMGDVTVNARELRQAYLEQFQKHQRQLESLAAQQEMDYQLLVTDQPLSRVLPLYLARRHQRLR